MTFANMKKIYLSDLIIVKKTFPFNLNYSKNFYTSQLRKIMQYYLTIFLSGFFLICIVLAYCFNITNIFKTSNEKLNCSSEQLIVRSTSKKNPQSLLSFLWKLPFCNSTEEVNLKYLTVAKTFRKHVSNIQ